MMRPSKPAYGSDPKVEAHSTATRARTCGGRGLPGKRGDSPLRLSLRTEWSCAYGTGHDSAFHIPVAYSLIVRSDENFPELPIFRMALRAQSPG